MHVHYRIPFPFPQLSLLEADNQKYKVLVSGCENLY